MVLCNVVQIHYLNIDEDTKAKNPGVYFVEDLSIDSKDQNKVTGSWLVSKNTTLFKGNLNFCIH